ncbi:MAG: MFS transporter [Chloroflexi bacterium]|nr:MFS transporter [Chloroflexota bacterium]
MLFSVLSRSGIPLFTTFFFFAVGTGAMQLARPLFAASLGASIFLVTLVSATMAAARMVASPVTGFLTDHWGRRPLVIAGATLRAVSALLEFFATSYEQFLLLEFVGSIGISVWNTGASIIIADLSGAEERGRAVALRNMSMRLGMITGPFFGALLATAFDLRAIFILNGASKLVVVVILLLLIRETRPEETLRAADGRGARGEPLDLSIFLSRAFLTVALASLAVSMMGGGGVFGALFPLHATANAGLSTADVGNLMTLAGVVALLVSFPNGVLSDRYGRKASLVPGLLILAAAAITLTGIGETASVLIAVLLFGMGEGIGMGTTQVFAMDLAPASRRGAFLGIWSLFNSVGGLAAPLLVGAVAQGFGFSGAFYTVAAALILSALVLWRFGPETGAGAQSS